MLLKGKMFSLHILQYQSAPVWTAVNSSPENGVQFLCTFRWQQLQCIKYEWFRIFLSQMGQVLFRSSMVIYESLQYICSQKNIALVADVGYNIGYLTQWPKGFLWWQTLEKGYWHRKTQTCKDWKICVTIWEQSANKIATWWDVKNNQWGCVKLTHNEVFNSTAQSMRSLRSHSRKKRKYSCWLIEAEQRIYVSVSEPSLVQIKACRRVSTKPLSGPMLEYWIRTLRTNFCKIFSKNFIHLYSRKCISKISSAKFRPFLSRRQCVKPGNITWSNSCQFTSIWK